jgi:hypothetical protein
MTVDELWAELVTTSLLGTDRRDPPDAGGMIGDLVADTARADPSTRMLAAVAACTAVRRAGVRPADPIAAVDRWHHITTSWPVLEDEWMLTLVGRGWRLAAELVPPALHRHRRDPIRRARVLVAAGPLAEWLLGHVPDLAQTASARPLSAIEIDRLGELPELPVTPELAPLLTRRGAEVGGAIAVGLEERTLAEAHRAVLVNVIARCVPDGLADIAEVLGAVDAHSAGYGLASVLADLALTRQRMLDELTGPVGPRTAVSGAR